MNRLRPVALFCTLAILASALTAAPLPKELKQGGDHAMIVGTWRLIESGSGVRPLNPGDGSSWRFDVEGQAAIIRAERNNDGSPKIDGGIKFTIDPNETPKQFDWMPNWGTYCGCYTLDGDKLVLYLRSGGKENRVKEAKQAMNVEVYSFERSK